VKRTPQDGRGVQSRAEAAEGRGDGKQDRDEESGRRTIWEWEGGVGCGRARTGHERAPRVAAERNYGRRGGAHADRTRRGRTGRAARYGVTCGGVVGVGPGPSGDGRSAAGRQVGPSQA
jgi:hypothetical protein